MGFYSFYKIFKDIIRTFFGYKYFKYILILIIAIIIFLTLGEKEVSAYDVSFDINNSDIDFVFPDWIETNNYYYAFLYRVDGAYLDYSFYVSTTPMKINPNTKYIYGNLNSISGGSANLSYMIENKNTFFANLVEPNRFLSSTTIRNNTYQNGVKCACNADILNYSTNEVLFANTTIPPFVNPTITNTQQELTEISFSNLFINSGSLSDIDNLYFHVLKITDQVSDGTNNIYYYSDKTFLLNNSSKYYKIYENSDYFYYSIPKYSLNLLPNTTYLLVLDNSEEQYNNSVGLINTSFNGVYNVYILNTSNYVTASDVTNDNLQNINNELDQTKQFQENMLSNEFDEDLPNDTLNAMGGGFRDSVDDTPYIGLFSAIFQKLSIIFNGNYDTLEEIKIYLPHSGDKYISLRSDLVKNFLYNSQSPALYDLVQIFWLYIFGIYVFSFSYSIVRAIKTGSLLGGYSWENETITSTML